MLMLKEMEYVYAVYEEQSFSKAEGLHTQKA